VWPPERQTLLLEAALAGPAASLAAWRRWNELCSLDEATSPEVRLLASVARRMAELDPGSSLMPRLTGARRYIFTRTQLTLATARPLLEALSEADLRMMLIKGAARIADDAALTSERTLRDVDVLVDPEDLDKALAIAERLGWQPRLTNRWAVTGSLAERFSGYHAIGLRTPDPRACGVVDIHHFALPMCRNLGDDAALWSRAGRTTLMGMPFFAPSPTDSVMISLVHSLLYSPGQKTADWALDIEPPINAGIVEWDAVLQEAHARRVEAFVAAPLIFAADLLAMAVPASVVASLAAAIDKKLMDEFAYMTTNPVSSFKNAHLAEAAARVAVLRSQDAARREPRPHNSRLRRRWRARPIRTASTLVEKELASFDLPKLQDPGEPIVLGVRFKLSSRSESPKVAVRCPGLILKVWRPPQGSDPARGPRRQGFMLRIPAALFMMRGISRMGIEVGPQTKLTSLKLHWLPAWRDTLRRRLHSLKGG
jgi:hypothetical protein